MATLRPFRDYDEKDVINLFALDLTGETLPVGKGTIVKMGAVGWNNSQELEMIGEAGDMSGNISNVTSKRYGVTAKVAVADAGDEPLGMLLFDVAEKDENGELLKFNPRKAAEIEAVIEGQAVPIVTRGLFLVRGNDLDGIAAGAPVYVQDGGILSDDSSNGAKSVGIALGIQSGTTANNDVDVLIKLNL